MPPKKPEIVLPKDIESIAAKFDAFAGVNDDKHSVRIKKAAELLTQSGPSNLRYLLPLLFNHKGDPFTLKDHFVFEPLFDSRIPQQQVWKTGRQVAKSTSISAKGVLRCNIIPDFCTLYVAPLFEMIKRLSKNVVQPFVDRSPIRRLWSGSNTENNVLQRSFHNYSKMIFSFAYLDVERIRGISADEMDIDEVQDMDPEFIPIIREVMSASKWGLSQFTGTPKTLENTIEGLWLRSSKAEWVIKCRACNYWNVPALSHDLDDMIGEHWDSVSEEKPGTVCAKCKRPVFPREGHWVHERPELRWDFAGYHVPQILMPMHYADKKKWKILLGKRAGMGNVSANVFYNEVLGESYDLGARLFTVTDIKAVATLHANEIDVAQSKIHDYTHRVLGVDWGGGGADETSFTTIAVLGMKSDGTVDVIYGWRSLRPHDHVYEAKQVLRMCAIFRCSHIMHDYSGAGDTRTTIMTMAGFPANRIMSIQYVGTGHGLIKHNPPDASNPRHRYSLVKSYSLQMLANLVRGGFIHFFQYDYKNDDDRGLLHDFLTLVEDKKQTRMGSDAFTIIRDQTSSNPDDFAHSVNLGCMGLFHFTQRWPDIAKLVEVRVEQEALEEGEHLKQFWESIRDSG